MQAVISRVHQIVAQPNDSSQISNTNATIPPPVVSPTTSASSNMSQQTINSPTSDLHTIKHDIQLAVDRLHYATLLNERKKAMTELTTLETTYSQLPNDKRSCHTIFALAAIPIVLNALVSDPRDTELMESMLEFLQMLLQHAHNPDTLANVFFNPSTTGTQVRSRKQPSGLQVVLGLLQDQSPWIRGPAVNVLKNLQSAHASGFASAVLAVDQGLRRMLDTVEDSREHIRDPALTILVSLTHQDKNVQQFLAFEDGFARLLAIMDREGLEGVPKESNVKVQTNNVKTDCLQIICNMVRDNLMTQLLFQDLPFFDHHAILLLQIPQQLDSRQEIILPDKRAMKLTLQLLRLLLAPVYEGVSVDKLNEIEVRDREKQEQVDAYKTRKFIGSKITLLEHIAAIAVGDAGEMHEDLQLQALDVLTQFLKGKDEAHILLHLKCARSGKSFLSEILRIDLAVVVPDAPVIDAASRLFDEITAVPEVKILLLQEIRTPSPDDGRKETNDEKNQDFQSVGIVLLEALLKNADVLLQSTARQDGSDIDKTLQSASIISWNACTRFTQLLNDVSHSDSEEVDGKVLALRIPWNFDDSNATPSPGRLLLSRLLRIMDFESKGSSIYLTNVYYMCIAILKLLIQWGFQCPRAVGETISSVTNISTILTLAKCSSNPQFSGLLESQFLQLEGLACCLLGICLEFPPAMHENLHKRKYQQQKERMNLIKVVSEGIGLRFFSDKIMKYLEHPTVMDCLTGYKLRLRSNSKEVLSEMEQYHLYFNQLYSKDFVKRMQNLNGNIQKRLIATYTQDPSQSESIMYSSDTDESFSMVNNVTAYQDIIRMQDEQIQALQHQIRSFQEQSTPIVSTNLQSNLTNPAQDDNGEKRIQLEKEYSIVVNEKDELVSKVESLKSVIMAMETQQRSLKQSLSVLELENTNYKTMNTDRNMSTTKSLTGTIEHEWNTLREENKKLQEHLQQARHQLSDQLNQMKQAEAIHAQQNQTLESENQRLHQNLAEVHSRQRNFDNNLPSSDDKKQEPIQEDPRPYLENANENNQSTVIHLKSKVETLESSLQHEQQTKSELEKKLQSLNEKYSSLKLEYEENKLAKLKVVELEEELAHVFLEKLELEKKFKRMQEDFENQISQQCCDTDDLLRLVGSLELVCSTLSESLARAKGEHAVNLALDIAKASGAIVNF